MITSLIEMQELSNFGHSTASTIEVDSRDKILLVTIWTKNYDVIIFVLGKPRETNFADIIKIATFPSVSSHEKTHPE